VLKVDKIIQLIGIVLLYLVGLSGSEDILGKKRAWLLLSVRKFVLHPLIHTFLKSNLAQYIESQSTLLRFGQRTPTNRTHFLRWFNHQVGFALEAFDRVEIDSFDFVSDAD